jgi:putative ABC transport system ATP-binding protein
VADHVIECVGLVKIYPSASGRVQALRGVDLVVARGDMLALVGPSGSGKSSLLRILAGLDEASAGRVSVDGVDFAQVRRRKRRRVRARLLSHVYQQPGDNLLGHLTAIEQVERVARRRGSPADAASMLERVGLSHRQHHRPDELSGGEQQRLALARAAVGRPALIIADEPTAELDTASTRAVLDTLVDLNRDGTTVVLATHDPHVLEQIDHAVTLRDGAIASVRRGQTELAAIDQTGRLQLPPELRARFPASTAELGWDDAASHMTATPP